MDPRPFFHSHGARTAPAQAVWALAALALLEPPQPGAQSLECGDFNLPANGHMRAWVDDRARAGEHESVLARVFDADWCCPDFPDHAIEALAEVPGLIPPDFERAGLYLAALTHLRASGDRCPERTSRVLQSAYARHLERIGDPRAGDQSAIASHVESVLQLMSGRLRRLRRSAAADLPGQSASEHS